MRGSPRRHVDTINIPLLIVHGDMDYNMDYLGRFDRSVERANALQHAKKFYALVKIEGVRHQMDRESDRVTLLNEIEAFLKIK